MQSWQAPPDLSAMHAGKPVLKKIVIPVNRNMAYILIITKQ
jgi:hypothetical protein